MVNGVLDSPISIKKSTGRNTTQKDKLRELEERAQARKEQNSAIKKKYYKVNSRFLSYLLGMNSHERIKVFQAYHS